MLQRLESPLETGGGGSEHSLTYLNNSIERQGIEPYLPQYHQATPMGRCTAKGKVQAQSHARQRQVQAPSEDPGEKLS